MGTDILKIERVDEVMARLGEKFMQRILTEQEQAEYRASTQGNRLLAKRFAAKEAVAKALGTGIGRGVSWQDIQIEHDDNGAPLVSLSWWCPPRGRGARRSAGGPESGRRGRLCGCICGTG